MKICVSATGSSLDAQMDKRFGRCSYFIIVDDETMQYRSLPNVAAGAPHGAGIQASQKLVNEGVEVVITGTVGPNAQRVLLGAGIRIHTGAVGNVREVIQRYRTGQLQPLSTS